MKIFEGKKIRDSILAKIQKEIKNKESGPHLAVLLVGDNPVCKKYVELKKKIAERTGVMFSLYVFDKDDSQEEIEGCVRFLNDDPSVDGVMIQVPVAGGHDQDKLIKELSPKKDVDGLRYCLGIESDFIPPVVLAIRKAMRLSGKEQKNLKIVLVGKGFLVGKPLEKCLKDEGFNPVVVDRSTRNLAKITSDADIVVSATGEPGLIKPEMVKEDVVLIDAGTAEAGGELLGDIDPKAYEKASYYTPVPGGIGPVTVSMLIKNLVEGGK